MSNNILKRRVVEIIDEKHLEEALRSGRKLRVKLGIDPTGKDLHLGHAVPLWKLREFQDQGHTAVFIIGDYTALIGDPSGKDKTRQALTQKQVEENAKDFFRQTQSILDKSRTEVHLQSEWFGKFDLKEVIHLASQVTMKQLLAHDTFRQRIKKDLPFYQHETIYPLLQGYDSVAVKADLELGASEQKFNVLMGRTIQKAYGQPSQDIMLVKYLIGLDGKEKMSKSLNNYIALTDSAEEMFGKTMSLPDHLITHYFELCTSVEENEIASLERDMKKGTAHPKKIKERLAFEITRIYHGDKKARAAQGIFEKKYGKKKDLGIAVADQTISTTSLKKYGPKPFLQDILVAGGLVKSKSEARRKIAEGAVEVNQRKVTDIQERISVKSGQLIRLGKRFLGIK